MLTDISKSLFTRYKHTKLKYHRRLPIYSQIYRGLQIAIFTEHTGPSALLPTLFSILHSLRVMMLALNPAGLMTSQKRIKLKSGQKFCLLTLSGVC